MYRRNGIRRAALGPALLLTLAPAACGGTAAGEAPAATPGLEPHRDARPKPHHHL